MRKLNQYRFEIHPLAEEEGGGFLITYPDFSDCISDGETLEEAIRNGMDALYETISALEELGHPVPQPSRRASTERLIELPDNLPLATEAKKEGMSLNWLLKHSSFAYFSIRCT